MQLSKGSRVALRATTYLTLGVLYTPLVLVFVLSFNSERSLAWPPAGFSTRWWSTFLDVESAREALLSSARIALIAMTIAVILGTLCAQSEPQGERYERCGVTRNETLLRQARHK